MLNLEHYPISTFFFTPLGRRIAFGFGILIVGLFALRIYAFDLLWLNGEDLRQRPLLERKKRLRKLLGLRKQSRVLYLDHLEHEGAELFTWGVQARPGGNRREAEEQSLRCPATAFLLVEDQKSNILAGGRPGGSVRTAVMN